MKLLGEVGDNKNILIKINLCSYYEAKVILFFRKKTVKR